MSIKMYQNESCFFNLHNLVNKYLFPLKREVHPSSKVLSDFGKFLVMGSEVTYSSKNVSHVSSDRAEFKTVIKHIAAIVTFMMLYHLMPR